ncbi:MAG: hypothetical protein WCD79_12825 [Chthoniobacteraceae bacterium]
MSASYIKIVLPMMLLLMAAFILTVALKTLIGRKPLFFSSRWLFGLMCVGFLPSIMNSFFLRYFSFISLLSPLMFVVLLGYLWFMMKGYTAFGVTDSYFRDALLASMSSLGYTAEESFSKLRIKETGEEFHVSVQGWMGSAQFKPVGKSNTKTTRDIAEGMNRYFATTPGKMNYIVAYLYLFLGVFLIAMCFGLATLGHTLKH